MSSENVGECDSDFHRLAVRFAGDGHESGRGLREQVITGSVGVARVAVESGDRAMNRAGVAAPGVVEAELSSLGRKKIIDDDVGTGDEFLRQLPA